MKPINVLKNLDIYWCMDLLMSGFHADYSSHSSYTSASAEGRPVRNCKCLHNDLYIFVLN